jgi:hypothetical protein
MLEGLGSVDRGIEQQRLNNQYNQQYATRMAPTQAASYVQGFAPQYQASRTTVNKGYGMPVDPLGMGISSALGTYRSFRPELQQPNQNQDIVNQLTQLLQNQQNFGQNTGTPAGPYTGAPFNPYAPNNPYGQGYQPSPPVSGTGNTFASNPQQGYPQQGYTGTYA